MLLSRGYFSRPNDLSVACSSDTTTHNRRRLPVSVDTNRSCKF